MKIRDFFTTKVNIVVPQTIETKSNNPIGYDSFSEQDYSPSLPVTIAKHNLDYIPFGILNDYPSQLINLYHNSPIHQSIINNKTSGVAGNGFKYDVQSFDPKQAITLQQFLSNPDGEDDLQSLVNTISLDLNIFGAYALEIIWNATFDKILRIKRVSAEKLRFCKPDKKGKVEYMYYSDNWFDKHRAVITKLPLFDLANKKDQNQIMYVKAHTIGSDFYALPDYTGSMTDIESSAEISNYLNSQLKEGFSPNYIISNFNAPESREERQMIVNGFKQSFQNMSKGEKGIILFNSDKENATTVEKIDVSNIDKMIIAASTSVNQSIITGSRVTSVELMGISVPGIGSTDIETAYKIWHSTVILPKQKVIEKTLNKILKINGLFINLKIVEFNPLADSSITITPDQTPII